MRTYAFSLSPLLQTIPPLVAPLAVVAGSMMPELMTEGVDNSVQNPVPFRHFDPDLDPGHKSAIDWIAAHKTVAAVRLRRKIVVDHNREPFCPHALNFHRPVSTDCLVVIVAFPPDLHCQNLRRSELEGTAAGKSLAAAASQKEA